MNELFVIGLIIIIIVFIFWRFIYFFRDPLRISPGGNTIVAPADGTIIYIKQIKNNEVPIAIKKKKKIKLIELTKMPVEENNLYLIGIFMHPTSVHVNRSPIKGVVDKILFAPAKNKPMTITWWRAALNLKPYERYGAHIVQNERNVSLIKNDNIFTYVIQIADIYVSRIDCWIHEGDKLNQTDKIGRIIFGSQVDLIFPKKNKIKILVNEGQKVLAGETILANYDS